MYETIYILIIGIFSGIFVGVLPGIGPGVLSILLYPFMMTLPLPHVFLFYFALVNSSQYYGSISAIVFGVAGELSSMPAVTNGHTLFLNKQGNRALVYTATGSFFAAIIGILLFGTITSTCADLFPFLLKGKVILSILITTICIMIFSSKHIIYCTIFGIGGYLAGQVGYNDLIAKSVLTFGNSTLEGGIPMYPLFSGLIIFPILIKHHLQFLDISSVGMSHISLLTRIKTLFDFTYLNSILRGTIIGFFVGLIPGASYTISSNISERIEHVIIGSDDDHHMKKLISAESANNSGTVSVLIPLIVLGVPIVMSEVVVLSVAEVKGFNYSVALSYFDQYFWYILISLIIINVLNWIISGLCYNFIIKIYIILHKFIYLIAIMICASILVYLGIDEARLNFSLLVCGLSVIIGLIVSDDSPKFVFVFLFFVSNTITDELYRIFFI